MRIHHLNCGVLHSPPSPRASCHCVLIESQGSLTLIDTGIGLLDVANPAERLGQAIIDAAGFQFDESLTAARQIERLGYRTEDVRDIVLTHADPDHAGGLADFPNANVHISQEEHANLSSGHWRYIPAHFEHGSHWVKHAPSAERWFGLEARSLKLAGVEAMLVPLFGHTLGHCGVAIREDSRWMLHVGDAYYLRVELHTDDHPVSALAQMRADADAQRRANIEHLRRLARDHADEITMFGYHDFREFPERTPTV